MSHPSKIKGNRFEREIVKLCDQYGIKAKRSWGSDGRSLGLPAEVDVVIGDDLRVQAKIRKRIATWIMPSDEVDAQVVRADRGVPYIIMRLEDYLDEIKEKGKR
jgi:Holliday junction resolvase